MAKRSPVRFPLMALGMVALVAGVWGGLMRMGWGLPPVRPDLAAWHGPLMISGFFGVVIGLERAVALGRSWTYAAPLFSALGVLATLAGPSGPLLLTLGSLVFVAVFIRIIRLEPTVHAATMGAGALSWAIGNVLWLAGWPVHRVVLWWVGYLVLTIAGERLELSRLLRLTGAARAGFLAAAGLFLAGLVLTVVAPAAGARLAGAGMLALTLWLMRHDIARRTLRSPSGLTRFIAACLLSGYAWLGVAGALAILYGGATAGPLYDAMLHAVFLGFVFAMIFGHAPVIFPAVLGLSMAFRPAFHIHLVLLHATLLLRVAGDLANWLPGRQWGGLLNALALLLFLVNTARAVRRTAPPAGAAP